MIPNAFIVHVKHQITNLGHEVTWLTNKTLFSFGRQEKTKQIHAIIEHAKNPSNMSSEKKILRVRKCSNNGSIKMDTPSIKHPKIKCIKLLFTELINFRMFK